MSKPMTTLFMLMSVDGKISTGSTDHRDADKDLYKIQGIKEGLPQYYDLEQKTDLHSLNSGRVMAKIGINSNNKLFNGFDAVNFIIIDNNHLESSGIKNLTNNLKKLYLVTSNKHHPAFQLTNIENLEIISYESEVDFVDLFEKLRNVYEIDNITVQSGGTLNSIFLRNKLIDKISIVVAPALIGGKDTPSLIDGKSLSVDDELKNIKALQLVDVKMLNDSYLHLKYDVINDTVLD
ncbi:dihydrofolate reductase family protein [Celerinatantimonas diazotrophica]|uniref:2,5-diamino-6-(Ribosylamino)-4(3H)-pyrimidinone 5'-phosphate reductase n=1 Tax=Celerinatantimonas diazotrophica TaxID=412034 RepID=A0A4R1J9S7_9GAMM|nr:dihydrofolate reductase family protein [Celerinatantimonas diazotrophica]TCK47184.1 2,5-diamino-6-(ribosylamino)-4(3H)-pyrimidinone 5'-phosphate reductase [Celerinatantimonas diazotrophica]CAG9295956.1 hypothetical protein CEDIAZO_01090 [Celerinatantimonas diazotrophica]